MAAIAAAAAAEMPRERGMLLAGDCALVEGLLGVEETDEREKVELDKDGEAGAPTRPGLRAGVLAEVVDADGVLVVDCDME